MSSTKISWLGPARPPFLLLTPACIALGVVLAARAAAARGGELAWADAFAALLGALAAHVSVNALNEVHDFRSGLDARTVRTPFSGGSGSLPARPELLPLAQAMAAGAFVLVVAVGVYFLWRWPEARGQLVALGLLGLALVAGYTPWLTRRPWACLVAPGLGFGPLMVVGTQLALAGAGTREAWLAAALPFCLVNNLLLLNQFPDVEADRTVGRSTLPMLLGRRRSAWVIGLQGGLGFAVIGVAVLVGLLPRGAAWCLSLAPVALIVAWGAHREAENLPGLLPWMGLNVALNLVAPLVLAVGLAL